MVFPALSRASDAAVVICLAFIFPSELRELDDTTGQLELPIEVRALLHFEYLPNIIPKTCYVEGIFGWFLTDRIHLENIPKRLFGGNSDDFVVEWPALKFIELISLDSKGILSCILRNDFVRIEVDDLSLCKDQ